MIVIDDIDKFDEMVKDWLDFHLKKKIGLV